MKRNQEGRKIRNEMKFQTRLVWKEEEDEEEEEAEEADEEEEEGETDEKDSVRSGNLWPFHKYDGHLH